MEQQTETKNTENFQFASDFKTSLNNGWTLAIDWAIVENDEYIDMAKNYCSKEDILEMLSIVRNYMNDFGVPTKGTIFGGIFGINKVFEIYIPNLEEEKEIHVYFEA